MKQLLYFLLIIVTISCNKASKLEQKINCTSTISYKLNQIKDFNNNFMISIPTSWKTNLYYDNISSEIYIADTLKELTKTFIIGVSFFKGNLKLNKEFVTKSDSLFSLEKLKIITSEKEKFINKPSYWYILSGTKKGFPFHQLNITIKNADKSYINTTVDIYGDKSVNNRICQAISILKTIQFLQ
ncbi:hypothetical protein [Lutibacter sp.]|uniref:hypothetical protein n=1 Tax=Lutibacter sp. TaxID=1925666 RepID=UPI0025BF31C3|nr:hypothetical protein [Lutibacter sp.]MCF6181790.1 hypothetical protein [Lutibacter sp.]